MNRLNRLRKHSWAFAVVLMLPLTTGASIPVYASTDPIPAGKHMSSRDVARANAKASLATEESMWLNGRITKAQFNHDVAAFLAKWGPATFANQRLVTITDPTTATSTSVASSQTPLDPGPPGTYELNMSELPEWNPSGYCQSGTTCYCGPAAAESVLFYLQPTSHDGETLDQPPPSWQYYPYQWGQFGLAGNFGSAAPYSWKYLETNVAHGSVPGGETPWYSGSGDYPMSQSIDYWISGSYSGFPYYVNYRPTSMADYQAKLKSDIWNGGAPGYPLVGDVEEVRNGVHLWGHPQGLEIQHWIVLDGYGPGTTSYIDSVANSALNGTNGFSVNPFNSGFSSTDMFTLVTDSGPNGGPYGIVW